MGILSLGRKIPLMARSSVAKDAILQTSHDSAQHDHVNQVNIARDPHSASAITDEGVRAGTQDK